jgi:hypothetical protein
MSVDPESDPRGFDGLASLVSVLPEPGARPAPPKAVADAAHSPSAIDRGLNERVSGNSTLKTAAIAFFLAFVLTCVILAIFR